MLVKLKYAQALALIVFRFNTTDINNDYFIYLRREEKNNSEVK